MLSLDGILNLIESVSEGFPTYSWFTHCICFGQCCSQTDNQYVKSISFNCLLNHSDIPRLFDDAITIETECMMGKQHDYQAQ